MRTVPAAQYFLASVQLSKFIKIYIYIFISLHKYLRTGVYIFTSLHIYLLGYNNTNKKENISIKPTPSCNYQKKNNSSYTYIYVKE